ncbi:unnamed protein product [marine sediment metagenome]|uniref:Uncharacterized protein n=1 Tax=marine sediment metagenome TaxID=412755 RepID=X0UMY1_9ZZZZ
MSNVRTHRFNKVKYAIDVEGFKGETTQKKQYLPRIVIARPDVTMVESLPYGNSKHARLMLSVLLHECLHASNWDKSEKVVERTSVDIVKLLWRLGYRRVKQ